MGPVADREHAHDVDLQRDHRAGGQAHGEIEREPSARVEFDVAARRLDGRRAVGVFEYIAVDAFRRSARVDDFIHAVNSRGGANARPFAAPRLGFPSPPLRRGSGVGRADPAEGSRLNCCACP